MIIVNGKEISLDQKTTVSDFLSHSSYQINRIAVEMNGQILPKSQYGCTCLHDGDRLEVVSFVGGG